MTGQGDQKPPAPNTNLTLRGLTLEEEIALEAYREATKAGLSSADNAADKVLTAAISIASAYAALLALVKPEKEAAPTFLAVPLLALGAAAAASAWSLGRGVPSLSRLDVAAVRDAVDKTVGSKRKWTGFAVLLLIVALGTAAWVVIRTYGAAAP